jgi:cobalamin biosynthesis protein CobD/CbiB
MLIGWERSLISTSPLTREEKIEKLTSSMRWKKVQKWGAILTTVIIVVFVGDLYWTNRQMTDPVVYGGLLALVVTFLALEFEKQQTDLAIEIFHLRRDDQEVTRVT